MSSNPTHPLQRSGHSIPILPEPLSCSVVIAAKNEEASISIIVRAARRFAAEVLVVDGHSTDETRERAIQSGAIVLLDNAKGKGDAMRVGAEKASQNILVFMDADGSHDPEDIPSIVAPILEQRVDMVIGSRTTGGSDELSGTFNMFIRLVCSQLVTLSINWRWKTQLTDSQNGFRAIRKDAFLALKLRENSYAIEQEMLMRALGLKIRVTEVPTHEYKRLFGKSHIMLRKVWFRHLYSWLKGIAFNN